MVTWILKPEVSLRFKSDMSIQFYVHDVLCVLEGWNIVTTSVFHSHITRLILGTEQSAMSAGNRFHVP